MPVSLADATLVPADPSRADGGSNGSRRPLASYWASGRVGSGEVASFAVTEAAGCGPAGAGCGAAPGGGAGAGGAGEPPPADRKKATPRAPTRGVCPITSSLAPAALPVPAVLAR